MSQDPGVICAMCGEDFETHKGLSTCPNVGDLHRPVANTEAAHADVAWTEYKDCKWGRLPHEEDFKAGRDSRDEEVEKLQSAVWAALKTAEVFEEKNKRLREALEEIAGLSLPNLTWDEEDEMLDLDRAERRGQRIGQGQAVELALAALKAETP